MHLKSLVHNTQAVSGKRSGTPNGKTQPSFTMLHGMHHTAGAMLSLLLATVFMMLRVEAFHAPTGTLGTNTLTRSARAPLAQSTELGHQRGWCNIAVSKATAQEDETKVADSEEHAEIPLDLAKVNLTCLVLAQHWLNKYLYILFAPER
jgi:hypothetical protein